MQSEGKLTQVINNSSHIKSNIALLSVQIFLRSSLLFSSPSRPPPRSPPSLLPPTSSLSLLPFKEDSPSWWCYASSVSHTISPISPIAAKYEHVFKRSGNRLKVSAISPQFLCILLIYPKGSYEFCFLTSLCSLFYKISY